MPRSLGALFVLGLLIVASDVTSAKACQCILQPMAAARDEATAVFQGRLERFEDVDGASYAVFRVRRVWKGEVTRSVRVRASQNAMCPPHLQVGRALIVYAMGPANDLRIDACSRTAFSEDDAAELGRARRALP